MGNIGLRECRYCWFGSFLAETARQKSQIKEGR